MDFYLSQQIKPHLHAHKNRYGTLNFWHHAGTALPIYTTKMIKFFSYWEKCQFCLVTPNDLSLLLLGMAEKIKP